MKLKPLHRQAEVRGATLDVEARTVSLSFSSETPVERWFGMEVLDHAPGAARMQRLNTGAPLLFNHDMNDVVGVVESARIGEDKIGYADVRFAKTARADEIMGMVSDGILRNVSFMYRIHETRENKKDNEVRATDWEPFEISIVTVPADYSIGIGRAVGDVENEVRIIADKFTAEADTTKEHRSMAEVNEAVAAPAIQVGAPPVDVEKLEVSRKQAIRNLCKANNLDVRFESQWINSGASLEQVSTDILKIFEERGKDNPAKVAEIGLKPSEASEYSLFRMIQAVESGDFSKAGFERACHEAVSARVSQMLGRGALAEKNFFVPAEVLSKPIARNQGFQHPMMQRDMTVGAAAQGGYLVETQNVGFIELLRNRSVVLNMGARRLSGLVGNLTIPKQTAGATANWMSAESGTGAAYSDQTLGQVAMSPKTVVAATKISRQLQKQSDPSAESMVMQDLALQVALAVDSGALAGSGASGQPTGIINTGGIGGFTGTSITYALLLDSQTDLALANALAPNAGYVSHPSATAVLMTRQRFTSTDTPLWEGNMLDGSCLGFRAMTSNQMTANRALFGDFSQCVIGEWGVLELAVNPVENFLAGIISVRAMYSVDVAVRYAGAFSYASNNLT